MAVAGKKVHAEQFAGAAACAGCHRDIYNTHIHTAHYRSSQPASDSSIKGSFAQGKNIFSFKPGVWVAMEKRDSGFYQVGYVNGTEQLARRFDMVVGSGAKGQTSLYWHLDHLYQLPITYFTAAAEWSNSPGYPQKPVFNRPITSRCLECHTTYANTLSAEGATVESFDKNSILYGIDCEKCHGPGAEHVLYQQQHPAATKGKFIVNPAALSRQQQLDACALCHGGKLQKTRPSFEFVAGDKLADFFAVNTEPADPGNIDLHGNQYGLLQASKCFKNSETLTCNTCHNTHENERGKPALFSARCQSCHAPAAAHGNGKICKLTDSLGPAVMAANCIDCHMPAKPSRAIAVFLPGASSPTAAYIRSHFISIYPEETKKFRH